ncbi:MAG: heme lyase CcmF/NrfE family subunit [Ardenticatenales bacterium]|nr:heme lyase CcmF/NrfE family subunit [Ardenticatenales bacterium]
MAELGYGCIAAAFGAAVYAAVASAIGARRGAPGLVQSGRRALWLSAGLSTAAVAVLEISLYRHDFSIAYVWKTSSLTTPGLYLMTALWGGQEGSLLFWSWLLGVFLSIALARPWRADVGLLPWFAAVGAVIMSFFLGLVVFQANPFARLDVLPADGNGLNALLQHPGMAFHPPMLYLGFTGLAVPYAFAVAALITRRLDASWLSASRRWLLVAWLCLTIGLALGGRWAYDVLGWGGYWGWDPVENAGLLPWLTATAFLHSIMAEERRGLFRTWNVALVLLTFCLSLIGTFLTRAGLVASVHAFAQSDIGDSFLAFTILVVAGSLALLVWRLPLLRSTVRVESVVSREAAFLGNNLLFMGALFAVFWGTTFPIISEWVTGQKVTIGPAYFNRLVLPILGAAVLLMGIGPLVAWRRADPRSVGRLLARPAFLSLALVAALVAGGVRQPTALAGFAVSAFAGAATLVEIARGVRARRRLGENVGTAFVRLVARNRRRYGGYIVHLGVVVLAVGITGNAYKTEAEGALREGDVLTSGAYALRFDGFEQSSEPDRQIDRARFTVLQGDRSVGTVAPSRQLFRNREEQPMTIPSVLHRPLGDVYALLGGFDPEAGVVTVKVHVNPLVGCVWLGLLVLALGTMLAAWPDGREQRVLDAELARLLAGRSSPRPTAA